ncbi:UNVERIFIED_CONTAM: hypothetical protein Sradi_1910900 [Sesamum radiatum]|uniref:CCHC-type domain-containing protein n=1 Tax=Sesamum radiatum TaxID=300843 RepID=A0AAW2TXJ1_SESRA
MEANLERLKQTLALTEDEEAGMEVVVTERLGNDEQRGYPLVGRLLTPRAFRYDVLRSTLIAVIRPIRGMEVKLLSDHRFLLRFNDSADRDRALRGCLWAFDRNLVILGAIKDEENPLAVQLTWCPFYVHVHGLPLRWMTSEIAESMGNRLGQFIECDNPNSWGATIRVRVALDISRPLKRFLKLRVAAHEVTVSFTYERLPNFCYGCGVLGHILRDCRKTIEDPDVVNSSELQYGHWLRESRSVGMSAPGITQNLTSYNGPWGRSEGKRGAAIFDSRIFRQRLGITCLMWRRNWR